MVCTMCSMTHTIREIGRERERERGGGGGQAGRQTETETVRDAETE